MSMLKEIQYPHLFIFIFNAYSLTIVKELIDGLNTYINFFMNTLLLYNFEREQYHSFFPQQKVPPDLLSLHVSTPPVTPLISPKISTLTCTESKDSSRSSSRSSSFSEDLPLSTNVRKRGRERKKNSDNKKRRRRGGESSSDKTTANLIGVDASYVPRSPKVDGEINRGTSSRSSSAQRETRSSRSSSKTSVDVSIVKEEPIENHVDEKSPDCGTDKSNEGSIEITLHYYIRKK